jgi:hypothetical protein
MSHGRRPTLRASSLILAAGCLLAISSVVRADQVVYFLNGKAITVKKVEKGDKLTILEIEGGGRIGIPTVQIDRIEELTLSPGAPVAPQTQVTAIIPPQPTAPAQPAIPPQAAVPGAMPAGPGTGGHTMAQNSAMRMAQPLSVGADPADDGPPHPPAAAPQSQAQAGTQSSPGGMMGPQTNRGGGGMTMGGPGALQRNRNGRGGNNYARGRVPAGYANPGSIPPQGSPAANGVPGQANGPGQPNTAGQPGGATPPNAAGAPNGGNQAAQTGQPAQPPSPPPTPPAAATPPPPPPPDPDPGPADSGNSDTSDDGSSSSDNESSPGGDSGN